MSVIYEDCKTAHLRDIGSVQSSTAILGVDVTTNQITFCSANIAEFAGRPPEDLLGCVTDLLPAELKATLSDTEGRHLHWLQRGDQWRPVAAYRRESQLFLEVGPVEASAPQQRHWWDHNGRTQFLSGMRRCDSPDLLADFALDWLFKETPYQRILFYRFLPNWDGEVTHERRRDGVETYLGLRFPAADIPENARRLFVANQHRVIMDIHAPAIPLVAAVGTAHQVDLTQSWLRAVHPAHLDYLYNMRVEASLTISIVVEGKLWGLIACHHSRPYCPSFKDRFGFNEIAELLSLQFNALTELARHEERSLLEYKLSPLLQTEYAEAEPRHLVASYLDGLMSAFRASGGWMRIDGQDLFAGEVPNSEARDLLIAHIHQERETNGPGSFASETLDFELQGNAELVQHASGWLFLDLDGSDFLLLLRPELISTINWAGERPAPNEGLAAHCPRTSFLSWAEQVRFSAVPWSPVELSVARQLRDQIVLRIHNAKLSRVAQHDPLTGLGNRRLFDQRLAQAFRKSAESNTSFALHLIDLDHFKEVNDRLGHAAGDEALREAAVRLQDLIRSHDTLARIGGDEFALIQSGIHNPSAAAVLAGKIVQALAKPMNVVGEVAHVGASLGVALYPAHGLTREHLMHRADIALYSVKRAGRNGFAIYEPDIKPNNPTESSHSSSQ